jgi:hypothetical protein
MEPGDELTGPTESSRSGPSRSVARGPSGLAAGYTGEPARPEPSRGDDPQFWLTVLLVAATIFAVGAYVPFRYGYPLEYLAFPLCGTGGALGSIAITRWQLVRRTKEQEERQQRLDQLPSFEVYTPPRPPRT